MSTLIDTMIQSGELSPAARGMDPFDVLVQWAEANAIETVSAFTYGGWDDYAWKAEVDGDTRRIVLVAPIPFNDIVLYFSTTDADLLAALAKFAGSGAFERDNGLDKCVTRLCPADS